MIVFRSKYIMTTTTTTASSPFLKKMKLQENIEWELSTPLELEDVEKKPFILSFKKRKTKLQFEMVFNVDKNTTCYLNSVLLGNLVVLEAVCAMR